MKIELKLIQHYHFSSNNVEMNFKSGKVVNSQDGVHEDRLTKRHEMV